jgi:ABC-type sugar transport system substrate-binding protein
MKSIRQTLAIAGSTLLVGLASSTVLASAAEKMTVGILGANYAIESARAQYESVAAGLIERGFEVKFLDARLDINTQVSQVDQLVDQKVDAIVVNVAGDPNALLGSLKRADAAGVKVFSIGATPGFDKTLVEVDLPSQELGQKSGEYMCKETGGTGEIALIEAIDIPVLSARWDSFLATIKEKCPELKVVDIQRAIPDDAATTRPLAEDVLTRFPDLKGIWAMGDGPALGAGLAAQGLGRKIIVTGLNAEGQGINGVKQGAISATWDLLPTDIGYQLSVKIADIMEGKTPAPAKTEVFTVSNLPEWNKDNAGDWKPYDQRIKYPGLQ